MQSHTTLRSQFKTLTVTPFPFARSPTLSKAPADTTILDVALKVAHSALVTLGKDIGADWDIDYELDLGLTLDLPLIGNFTIPLSSKGEIKLPTLSDLWNK
ncbi:hypothetical protein CsSME_00023790 [Camellia sinensis var. sinensis]